MIFWAAFTFFLILEKAESVLAGGENVSFLLNLSYIIIFSGCYGQQVQDKQEKKKQIKKEVW